MDFSQRVTVDSSCPRFTRDSGLPQPTCVRLKHIQFNHQRTQRRDSKKTSTNSLRCSQEVEHSISIESSISEDSLRSVSSSYSSQTSMGSIDETDTGGCEKQPRMQCDSGISAKLDFVSQGGSLVELLDSGNLALAPSSGSPSVDPPPPYDLFRYRYCNGPNGGEIILLRSQRNCRRFLTGHTGLGSDRGLVDARTEFPQGSHVPKSDSFWRPVPYKDAFENTPYFQEDRANKGYIVLQHWAEYDRPHPDDYRNGRYFVIEYSKDTNKWKYYLGTLISCSMYGLFVL